MWEIVHRGNKRVTRRDDAILQNYVQTYLSLRLLLGAVLLKLFKQDGEALGVVEP
jgi:hypothetical protein